MSDDLVESALVASASAQFQSVLSRVSDASSLRGEDRLLYELDGGGSAVGGIGHFEASEAEGSVGALKHLGDGEVAIVSVGVVVATSKLSAVVGSVIPPVNARNLGRDGEVVAEDGAGVFEDF